MAKDLFVLTKPFRPHKAAGILFLRFTEDKDLEGIFGVDKDDIIKLPGGKAEFGEDPWTTAVREVREETSTAIVPATWKGRVALRSCYYQPAPQLTLTQQTLLFQYTHIFKRVCTGRRKEGACR